MIRKIFKWTFMTLGACAALVIASSLGIGMVQSFDNSLGTTVPDGTAVCPVFNMLVAYSRNAPRKTTFVDVRCDNGPWGFASMSSTRYDEWHQAQELLDETKMSDLFVCERFKKRSASGLQEYFFYKTCVKQ